MLIRFSDGLMYAVNGANGSPRGFTIDVSGSQIIQAWQPEDGVRVAYVYRLFILVCSWHFLSIKIILCKIYFKDVLHVIDISIVFTIPLMIKMNWLTIFHS